MSQTEHKNASRKAPLYAVAVMVLMAQAGVVGADDKLVGRAVLPAATFAQGPTSGAQIGAGPINGQAVPFFNRQPVQGFSAVLDSGDGGFLVMSDNGFGSMENSADFNLRVYRIRPDFKTKDGGSGAIAVEGFIELHDPDKHVPFAITNHFTAPRVLTGADFDIESFRKAPDGSLWFGDEFGPFLLHTDANGRVLEAPIALPDFDNGGEIRSPQNPFNEEASAVRVMNAVRTHARMHGNAGTPVFSPYHAMLQDSNPAVNHYARDANSPPDLAKAASEVFDVASLQRAGYPIVTWTVNDKPRMTQLLRLKLNGIISDRPDLLLQAVREFDANSDGTPGDLLKPNGLIDGAKFDAQGHRGARNLRPENTLPAMEAALDYLMVTLETDTGISQDDVPLLNHDPYVEAQKCRRADGQNYTHANQVLIKNLTAAEIQTTFVCDKLFRGPPQSNDLNLSPVAVAFAAHHGLAHVYAMPTLQQLFDFVAFYADYYQSGAGQAHADAPLRWMNAEQVRFNIETKINPRSDRDALGKVYRERTTDDVAFADTVAGVISTNGLQQRADIQSFDFRSLLRVQERFPAIRTVYLFGDFPIFNGPDSDDGTNLQDENGANTPWLAGLYWPYRLTALTHPFRAQRSGGFEGMALSMDGERLLPLLEKPLAGGEPNTLLIHEFDLNTKQYSGKRHQYVLEARGTAIGDFTLFGAKHGLVIERDDTQGDLNGFKAIFEIELQGDNQPVEKTRTVDLLNIRDPRRISEPAQSGDVGLGKRFAFPFVTIEDVVVFDRKHIGVLNDNNYPFSVGRHAGGQPDDNEFIVIKLDEPLSRERDDKHEEKDEEDDNK